MDLQQLRKVLDASPVHVKALYMLGGDFDEARNDFKTMITIDKSSEPDATAALLKLKQKEQQVEKKARTQFKGLFDKKPGEIAEVGTDSGEGCDSDEQDQNSEAANHAGDEAEHVHEADRIGLFARLWPSGRRILKSLGLHKCSTL